MRNMIPHSQRALAALALIGLAACGGGGGTPAAAPAPVYTTAPPTTSFGTLVGVGDSLTAGYQSSGFLGDPTATSPVSAYPGNAVPPGQLFGFFADMYQQSTGKPAGDPINGPLPLIKAPGLANQLVLNATTLIAPTHTSGCDAFNVSGYSSTGWQSTRLNPAAGITDLGVPGITMHEAVAMTGPLTGPPSGPNCGYVTIPGDPTSGNLQSLVSGESELFYPVLGSFESKAPTTMLQAAVQLKPSLTTVLLGANDLLKYSFSGGQECPPQGNPTSGCLVSDTPQQLAADLTQIVTTLKANGSKVLVGNLPTILSTPQFFPQTKPSVSDVWAADMTPLLVPGLVKAGLPLATAQATAQAYATSASAYIAANITMSPLPAGGSYLTESGFLAATNQVAQQIAAGVPPPSVQIVLDPSGAGSGLGGAYLTPAFAGAVSALNAAYNQAIGSVVSASGSGVALVDLNAVFTQAAATGYPVAPGETMTLQFGGGLLSFDGLHPSNVGYAVMANAFIAGANGLGIAIPPLSGAQIAAIANGSGPIPPDPYNPYAIKAVNPNSPLPLP